MDINEEYAFTVIDEYGNETICDTLSVVNIEGEKPIIIYTDYTLDKENKFNLYVSNVIKDGNNFKLNKIEDYSFIPEIQEEIKKICEQANL